MKKPFVFILIIFLNAFVYSQLNWSSFWHSKTIASLSIGTANDSYEKTVSNVSSYEFPSSAYGDCFLKLEEYKMLTSDNYLGVGVCGIFGGNSFSNLVPIYIAYKYDLGNFFFVGRLGYGIKINKTKKLKVPGMTFDLSNENEPCLGFGIGWYFPGRKFFLEYNMLYSRFNVKGFDYESINFIKQYSYKINAINSLSIGYNF